VRGQAVPGPQRTEAALQRWLEEHGLASYDPYDGLACAAPWSIVRRHQLTARLWTQLIKKSPINLRPFVGIEPRVSAKSLADLAAAALLRHRLGDGPDAMRQARDLLSRLRTACLPGYAGACWAMATPYVSRYVEAGPDTPNLFWSVSAAGSFLDAYELERDPADLALARSVIDFVQHDLGSVDDGQGGVWFRYFAAHEAAVHNVAALTGALLLRVASHTQEADLAALGHGAFRFVLGGQNPDGSWNYARGPRGRWIDGFHTGYVLEALLQAVLMERDPDLEAALGRGVHFYLDRLFSPSHLPCYTADRFFPIDVQNCAQAVQTLAKLSLWQPDIMARAQAVTEAVTRALFVFTRRDVDEAGYFLMSRGRWVTNRVSAVRWGQAPMLLALTHLRAASVGLGAARASARPSSTRP